MFESNDDLLTPEGAAQKKNTASEADLIAELERQSLEQIRQVRAHERYSSKVSVELRHGNASAKEDLLLCGKTNDISEGGCSVVFPSALLPGDIFQLTFDSKAIDLPVVFARAMRCRFLKEGSYEMGFRFFTPVVLRAISQDGEDLFD